MTTETDTARQIASGTLPSPRRVGNFTLAAIRVSGTGRAERPALNELTVRPAAIWTSPEMLARCNGLPVLVQHPEKGLLDSAEAAKRTVGSVTLPYIANSDGIADPSGSELWAVARVTDDNAAELIATGGWSTSPAVAFDEASGNQLWPDGTLREGNPNLIDHVALVPPVKDADGNWQPGGVWDKGGAVPPGVRIDSCSNTQGTSNMSDETTNEPKNELQGVLDGIASLAKAVDGIGKRLDAVEKRGEVPSRDAAEGDEGADRVQQPLQPRGKEDDEAENLAAEEKAEAQQRFDHVAMCLGEKAFPPMLSQTPLEYRAKAFNALRRHSKQWQNVDGRDLAKQNPVAFKVAEDQVYADAIEYSKNPIVPAGYIREVKRMVGGREVVEFHAPDYRTVFGQFMLPPLQVKGIRR